MKVRASSILSGLKTCIRVKRDYSCFVTSEKERIFDNWLLEMRCSSLRLVDRSAVSLMRTLTLTLTLRVNAIITE